LINLNILNTKNYLDCYNLLTTRERDLQYYKNLGWTLGQFKLQFINKSNYGTGLFDKNVILAFVFGNLISIDKKLEYEILLIYVNEKKRNLGYATKLLNNILENLETKKLEKINLEVSSNNINAINLYEKFQFKKIGIRKKYYLYKDTRIDGYCFEKIINE